MLWITAENQFSKYIHTPENGTFGTDEGQSIACICWNKGVNAAVFFFAKQGKSI